MRSTENSPITRFKEWYEAAKRKVKDPSAMVLSTCRYDHPDSRVVLMKDFNERGFTFYTNYNSDKGHDLQANNLCALLFYWPEVGRQIRIQGTVRKISRADSERYFNSRPIISRYGAACSKQSREMHSRQDFLVAIAKMMLSGKDPKCPDNWGGYIVDPTIIEFWEEGAFRLHTREKFYWRPNGWERKLLYP